MYSTCIRVPPSRPEKKKDGAPRGGRLIHTTSPNSPTKFDTTENQWGHRGRGRTSSIHRVHVGTTHHCFSNPCCGHVPPWSGRTAGKIRGRTTTEGSCRPRKERCQAGMNGMNGWMDGWIAHIVIDFPTELFSGIKMGFGFYSPLVYCLRYLR